MIDPKDLYPGFWYFKMPNGKVSIMEVNDSIRFDYETNTIEQSFKIWFIGDIKAYGLEEGFDGEIIGPVILHLESDECDDDD